MASEAPNHCEVPVDALERASDQDVKHYDRQALFQRVGGLLQAVLITKGLSSACEEALERMAESGTMLSLPVMDEIRRSGALADSVKRDWGERHELGWHDLVKLRRATAACVAAAATSDPEITLSTLNSIVLEAIDDEFVAKVERFFEKTVADAREVLNAQAVGNLVLVAVSRATELASAVSQELHEAIQALADAGTPLAEHLTAELESHLPAIREALADEDWADLRSRFLESTTAAWQALGEAARTLGGLALELAEVTTAMPDDVFDSPFGKAIAAQGLSGLDGVFAESRESVDAALDALRGGGAAAAGTLAVWLARAGLPPLLRLEIARDFFQTVGLFFGGLYATALAYIEQNHVAADMSRFLNGVTGIYDVASINVLQVVQKASISNELMVDIAVWLLIAAVGTVYLSFLWFACSGRHLHRRQDEVRQGHEAETWAELATKQRKKVVIFTFVITACLTVYLPLTRLCLDVLMGGLTSPSYRASYVPGNYGGYGDGSASNSNDTGYGYGGSGAGGDSGDNNGGYYGDSALSGGHHGYGSASSAFYSDTGSSRLADPDPNDGPAFSAFMGVNDSRSFSGSSSSSVNVSDVITVTRFSNSSGVGTSASELVGTYFEDNETARTIIFIAAFVLLATFTLPLPKLLVRAISENRPTGSLENASVTYDLDGEEVPFDDKVYERLIQRDPNQLRCPYRSLYAGFEQRWSYYKVLQVLVKLVLAVVIAATPGYNLTLRGVILCVFYACVVALTSYSTPFTDPLNNVMDISGKVTALVTCLGGLVASMNMEKKDSGPSPHTQEAVAIVVSTAHIVNLFVMLVVLLLGMPNARLWVKNLLGWVTFSDTCRGIDDGPARNVLPLWDLEREAKHRVWQAFWRALLLDMARQGSKESTERSLIDRLTELEQAIVASGIHRVRAHWQGEEDEERAKLRQALRSTLEGVDVYWDDATGTRDGHLDSKSCFGKMYVVPYPFHCVVVYDDCEDETILRDDGENTDEASKLAKLLALNLTPRIVAKRELRHKLRVLSDRNTLVNLPFSRLETVTVPDGVIQTTDANGYTQTIPRFTPVTFTCYYTNGAIDVGSNGDAKGRAMAEGFDVSMTYRDGQGDAIAPHTCQVFHQSSRVAVMGEAHIGLTSAMVETQTLSGIFAQTRDVWEAGVPQLREAHHEYRRALETKHGQANATLTDAFWFFVYNNPHISREQLEAHFKHREANPKLKLLAATHQVALDSLYLRMAFVHSHPAVTFWFVFWDDVFARNADMRRLRTFKQALDPRQPTAICYHAMKRPELEKWLRERQLLGKQRLFHPRLLDLLYQEMEKRLEDKQGGE